MGVSGDASHIHPRKVQAAAIAPLCTLILGERLALRTSGILMRGLSLLLKRQVHFTLNHALELETRLALSYLYLATTSFSTANHSGKRSQLTMAEVEAPDDILSRFEQADDAHITTATQALGSTLFSADAYLLDDSELDNVVMHQHPTALDGTPQNNYQVADRADIMLVRPEEIAPVTPASHLLNPTPESSRISSVVGMKLLRAGLGIARHADADPLTHTEQAVAFRDATAAQRLQRYASHSSPRMPPTASDEGERGQGGRDSLAGDGIVSSRASHADNPHSRAYQKIPTLQKRFTPSRRDYSSSVRKPDLRAATPPEHARRARPHLEINGGEDLVDDDFGGAEAMFTDDNDSDADADSPLPHTADSVSRENINGQPSVSASAARSNRSQQQHLQNDALNNTSGDDALAYATAVATLANTILSTPVRGEHGQQEQQHNLPLSPQQEQGTHTATSHNLQATRERQQRRRRRLMKWDARTIISDEVMCKRTEGEKSLSLWTKPALGSTKVASQASVHCLTHTPSFVDRNAEKASDFLANYLYKREKDGNPSCNGEKQHDPETSHSDSEESDDMRMRSDDACANDGIHANYRDSFAQRMAARMAELITPPKPPASHIDGLRARGLACGQQPAERTQMHRLVQSSKRVRALLPPAMPTLPRSRQQGNGDSTGAEHATSSVLGVDVPSTSQMFFRPLFAGGRRQHHFINSMLLHAGKNVFSSAQARYESDRGLTADAISLPSSGRNGQTHSALQAHSKTAVADDVFDYGSDGGVDSDFDNAELHVLQQETDQPGPLAVETPSQSPYAPVQQLDLDAEMPWSGSRYSHVGVRSIERARHSLFSAPHDDPLVDMDASGRFEKDKSSKRSLGPLFSDLELSNISRIDDGDKSDDAMAHEEAEQSRNPFSSSPLPFLPESGDDEPVAQRRRLPSSDSSGSHEHNDETLEVMNASELGPQLRGLRDVKAQSLAAVSSGAQNFLGYVTLLIQEKQRPSNISRGDGGGGDQVSFDPCEATVSFRRTVAQHGRYAAAKGFSHLLHLLSADLVRAEQHNAFGDIAVGLVAQHAQDEEEQH